MWILVWIVCLFLAPMIASAKGNSAGWAFVGAVLLGPIGVLIALVAPRDQAALDKRAVEGGDMRKCTACAEIVKREAVKCRFCGTTLEPVAAAPPPAPAADWPTPGAPPGSSPPAP
jgi:hypothetical protein